MTHCGALRQVADGDALARAVATLLDDTPTREAMITAAHDFGADQSRVLQQCIEALALLLDKALTRTIPARRA